MFPGTSTPWQTNPNRRCCRPNQRVGASLKYNTDVNNSWLILKLQLTCWVLPFPFRRNLRKHWANFLAGCSLLCFSLVCCTFSAWPCSSPLSMGFFHNHRTEHLQIVSTKDHSIEIQTWIWLLIPLRLRQIPFGEEAHQWRAW